MLQRDNNPNMIEVIWRFLMSGQNLTPVQTEPPVDLLDWQNKASINPITKADTNWVTLRWLDSNEDIPTTFVPPASIPGSVCGLRNMQWELIAYCGITKIKLDNNYVEVNSAQAEADLIALNPTAASNPNVDFFAVLHDNIEGLTPVSLFPPFFGRTAIRHAHYIGSLNFAAVLGSLGLTSRSIIYTGPQWLSVDLIRALAFNFQPNVSNVTVWTDGTYRFVPTLDVQLMVRANIKDGNSISSVLDRLVLGNQFTVADPGSYSNGALLSDIQKNVCPSIIKRTNTYAGYVVPPIRSDMNRMILTMDTGSTYKTDYTLGRNVRINLVSLDYT